MKIMRFTAEWCQPCKTLEKILNEINVQNVEVIDIESDPDSASKYKIRSVPTMIMIEDDHEISRLTGSHMKEKIQSWIKSSTKS